MKKIIIIAAILTTSVESRVLTVDNRINGVAEFKTFREAYEVAEDGDTILLAGSPQEYEGGLICKRLNLVGPGYLLRASDVRNSFEARITLGFVAAKEGAEQSEKNSAGSTVVGLVVDSVVGVPEVGELTFRNERNRQRISFEKCRFPGRPQFYHGCSFVSCVFDDGGFFGGDHVGHKIMSSKFSSYVTVRGGSQTIMKNCIVSASPRFVLDYIFEGHSLVRVENTILFRTNGVDIARGRSDFRNCLVIGSDTLTDNGTNRNATWISDVFVEKFEEQESFFRLKPNSPAIGAGIDGDDLGIYGGSFPYVPFGLPDRPRVQKIVAPGNVTRGTGLRFRVEAKSFGELAESNE